MQAGETPEGIHQESEHHICTSDCWWRMDGSQEGDTGGKNFLIYFLFISFPRIKQSEYLVIISEGWMEEWEVLLREMSRAGQGS